MSKIRVYKVAENLGMPTKEVVDLLKELGVEVKNHMSNVDEELVELLQEEISYQKKKEEEARKKQEKTLSFDSLPTLREVAKIFNEEVEELILELADLNMVFGPKDFLPPLVVERLARERGWYVKWEKDLKELTHKMLDTKTYPRPPVVTILGHVDHGKTTLLDAIRSSQVAETEFGGITQKIGAYQVEIDGRKITFIDTPGHEAFTTMRARGAQATDIAVLVVAADDGVMPQTVEAIQHAKAANVPIIVAINKIDKVGANPERVKQQLAEYDLIPEEWGGETIFVNISALQKKGISDLLDLILLQADLLELQARHTGYATGVVIESRLDRGRGPVATVIVQEGILKVGDYFVAGSSWGRVKSLLNYLGKTVREAYPSTPVEVVGFSDLPPAGTKLMVVGEEKIAHLIAERRKEREKEKLLKESRPYSISLEEMLAPEEGKSRELNLILKADFQGSLEALEKAIASLEEEEVKINIVYQGVGNITETDIMLASASQGIVIGFNVRLLSEAAKIAKREGVEVRLYRVIYEVIDDIEKAIKGLIEPRLVEETLGRAEVRAIFKIPRVGEIAGSYVTQGKIERGALARILRGEEVIKEGAKITSLKRFKEDVREVTQGYECGIGLENFDDFQEGDILEAYVIKEEEK
ncbi:MAG TPA: translation initiation factor IF-2 [Candidatus Atribacteria bacterium]|jgi:translation initiation factor IF-2|uniref:translation initiation factor IF-2 n=1 Tax=Candidatus Sordicultor fermentans TaxID=1953203 RepID=UPI00169F9985|nr:translation initiation factor IF-2 [Atribacterota bacterium]NLY05111.1 translation initiation factor IF-2 [Candidatus Atribacteria bacterium]MDI9607407.1 translation initiation factor IF-2 [Atribacterota bacterium]HOA99417.1 translation initiation factor IF-2 [Candidatus Atribacteria bacterium]HOQ51213.1 translation initiation factor IF-2 [Candidatus Atribacteria bacterium]